MDKKLLALIVTVGLALISVIGDYFINLAGEGRKYIITRWFVIGLIIYASTAFGWFFVMKHIKLSTMGVYYAVPTIVFLALISVFSFKESINIYEVLGIILAILSVVLMAKFAWISSFSGGLLVVALTIVFVLLFIYETFQAGSFWSTAPGRALFNS